MGSRQGRTRASPFRLLDFLYETPKHPSQCTAMLQNGIDNRLRGEVYPFVKAERASRVLSENLGRCGENECRFCCSLFHIPPRYWRQLRLRLCGFATSAQTAPPAGNL